MYFIEKVEIPESVFSIETQAFYGCSSLQSITIKSKTIFIGNMAFWGCGNLQTIYYLGINQPSYNSNNGCPDYTYGCNSFSCSPFSCSCNSLTTVYVLSTYQDQEDSFCGKDVSVQPISI